MVLFSFTLSTVYAFLDHIDFPATLLEIKMIFTALLPVTQNLYIEYLHKVVRVNPDHHVVEYPANRKLS